MKSVLGILGATAFLDILVFLFGDWIPHGFTHLCFHRMVRILNAEVIMYLVCSRFVRPRLEELARFKSPTLRDTLRGVLLLMQWLVMLAYGGHYAWVRAEPVPLVLYSFITLGFFIHLSGFLLVFWVGEEVNARTLGLDWGLVRSARLHTALALAAAAAFTLAGLAVTSRPPIVLHHDVRIKDLHPSLEGYRIALVTDVHIGPTVGTRLVRQMVDIVNKEKPDAVAIVGDLVDGFVGGLRESLRPLRDLRSKDGVLYVTGNHEYYHSHVSEWLEVAEAEGLRVLRNAAHSVRDGRLCFAGVDDVSAKKAQIPGHAMSPRAALSGCAAGSLRVLLTHQPNSIDKMLEEEPDLGVDLFLSGHTHGGQLYIVAPLVWVLNTYLVGHYQVSGGRGQNDYRVEGTRWAIQWDIEALARQIYEMKSNWTLYVISFISLYFTQRWLFHYIIDGMAGGPRRMHLMRVRQLVDITFVSLPFSYFILHRFRAMIKPPVALLPEKAGRLPPHNSVLQSAGVGRGGLFLTWAIIVANHTFFLVYYVQEWVPYALSWTLTALMGAWTYLLGFLLGFALLNAAFRVLSSLRLGRALLKPLLSVTFLRLVATDPPTQTALGYLMALSASQVSLIFALVIRTPTVEVHLHHLHPTLAGFRIAVLTDLHTGPSVSSWHLTRAVAAANALEPDLVVIVGDLEDGTFAQLRGVVEPLRGLRAKYGTLFVTGNHEYYYGDLEQWVAGLRGLGLRPLLNAAVRLPPENPRLCAVGLNDISSNSMRLRSGNMSIEAGVAGCAAEDTLVVLAHNPNAVSYIVAKSPRPVDLILSGHVHAGQLYVTAPLLWVELAYFWGLYNVDGRTQLLVSAGVHYWAAPMKTAACSEIPLVRLS